MKINFIFVFLVLSLDLSSCEVELVQKGYYNVFCDDVFISQHSSERKAIQVAINKNSDCYIKSPILTIKGTLNPDPPVLEDNRVELTWDQPTKREDGSDLLPSEIKHYVIYYGTDQNSLSDSIVVDGLSTIMTLDVGTWYFAISTVDSDGMEGQKSNVITQVLP